jgi:hypothetical protein
MRFRVFAIAVLACVGLSFALTVGCGRLKRVGTEEIKLAPPATIIPPITTVAPPQSVIEAPTPTEIAKEEIQEVAEAMPKGLKEEFGKLNALLSELDEAVSAQSVEKVEAVSLRMLIRLAHIEVMAVEQMRGGEDALKVSEVIKTLDEVRANLRDVRNALKRGSAKVAGASVDELKERVKSLESLLVKGAEETPSLSPKKSDVGKQKQQ